jgi:hypothetical protein
MDEHVLEVYQRSKKNREEQRVLRQRSFYVRALEKILEENKKFYDKRD